MSIDRLISRIALLAAIALLALLALPAATRLAAQPQGEVLQLEIAEIPSRFAPAPFAFDPKTGAHSHGNAFITQGYLYPAGTLNGGEGVNPDGSPLYPDKVLGEWSCWGLVGGGDAVRPMTTQVFQLGTGYGNTTIVTNGYEIADGTAYKRAIVGGTGAYAGASGEQIQTFLGLNDYPPYGGVTFTVELRIAPR
jgi:hypothetical protein